VNEMELRTEWPQITYLSLIFLGLLIMSNKHGKQKVGVYSFWETLFASIPLWVILYFGGFFTK